MQKRQGKDKHGRCLLYLALELGQGTFNLFLVNMLPRGDPNTSALAIIGVRLTAK